MLQEQIERVWRPIERNWRGGVKQARTVGRLFEAQWRRLRKWWRARKRRWWFLREALLCLKWAAVIAVSMLLRRWFEQFVGRGWLVESILNGDLNHIATELEKEGRFPA
jgi:hypothetical protein